MRLPVRQPVAGGSARRPRRVAATLRARLAGIGLIVLAGGAMYWLTTAGQFRLDPARVAVSGLANTALDDVMTRLAPDDAPPPNVFRINAAALTESLRTLPSVASVEIAVVLPDSLDVRIVEREPLMIWRGADAAFLVDAAGVLLAGGTALSGYPTVHDGRPQMDELVPGDRLDEVEVSAARLLLTITPADVGSAARSLTLVVDDEDGFSLSADAPAWHAVFGFYSANQLPPADRIPRQRQCLSALIGSHGEVGLDVVYLAISEDGCGTYRAQPTPGARFFQNVGRPAT